MKFQRPELIAGKQIPKFDIQNDPEIAAALIDNIQSKSDSAHQHRLDLQEEARAKRVAAGYCDACRNPTQHCVCHEGQ